MAVTMCVLRQHLATSCPNWQPADAAAGFGVTTLECCSTQSAAASKHDACCALTRCVYACLPV